MIGNESATEDSFEKRDARALTEHITVVPAYDGTGDVLGVSPSTTCRIDTETLEGDCPDAEYNAPDGRCKHARRYEFASGRRPLPTWVDTAAITRPFGEHVDDVTGELESTAETSSGRVVATDGGTTVREAADDAEILEDDESDPWGGPFPEYDRYGELTGERYYRCRSCGREALESIGRDAVGHRDGCRHAEGGR